MKIKVYVAICGTLGGILGDAEILFLPSLEEAKEAAMGLLGIYNKIYLMSIDTPMVEEHTVYVPAKIGKSDIRTICRWIFSDSDREDKFWSNISQCYPLESELDELIKQKEAKANVQDH